MASDDTNDSDILNECPLNLIIFQTQKCPNYHNRKYNSYDSLKANNSQNKDKFDQLY